MFLSLELLRWKGRDGKMALTTQLHLSSIAGVCSSSLSARSGSSKNIKQARISRSAFSAFSRNEVGERLLHAGTLRTSTDRGRKQRGWTLRASGKDEVVSTGEQRLAADSTGTKNVEDNKNGPPVLTILAGLVVFAVVLYGVGSILVWFIGLFFR